jgi:ABC-2 type transport system permease protein
MATSIVGRPTLSQTVSAALAEARLRFINISRYPGQLLTNVIIPIVFASMPILLGRATGGAAAETNFALNTGSANYVGYLLIGSCVFQFVSSTFFLVANWLRFEQETGTLEAVYLTPTSSATLLSGVVLYSCVRSLLPALIAYVVGCLIYGLNPLDGNLGLALAFIAAGLVPLAGMSMLFGALVLKVKESNALLNLMQWVVSFLMGIFFPVAVMPPLLRLVAWLFPPTWMTNGVRSALLGVGYFFGDWYLDLAVLWAFMFLAPTLGWWIFHRTEQGVQRNEGMGQF